MTRLNRTKRLAAGGALVLAGIGVGAAVAATGSANAADTGNGTASTSTTTKAPGTPPRAAHGTAPDPSKPQRPDEHLLTGTTKTKVTDAALAKYPGATIQRVETDSQGVYEAHVVTKAGTHVIVQVGSDFTVTGTQTGGPGGPGGRGGDHDGDGPAAPPATSPAA